MCPTPGRCTTSRSIGPTRYVADGVLVHNSIYRFRGADIRNILEFEQAFPDATVIVLEQNYRSTQTILDAANAVIANNLGRKPKELWTDQGLGEPIVRYHADDEGDEAQWVAHQIAPLHDEGDRRWGDVAVFYRTNAQSRVLEEQLMRVGIPYKVRRRHPVLRPARDQGRARLPEGGRRTRPTRSASSGSLNVPKRGVGDTHGRPARRVGDGHGRRVHRRAAPGRRRGRDGPAREGHRRVPRAARRAATGTLDEGPAPAARAHPRRSRATSPSSRPSTRSRRRAGSRTSPSWSASAREFDVGRRLPRAGRPRRRHRRARRRRRRRSC